MYTYDTGDNMTSQTEPWVDDFSDGAISDDGWTLSGGTWSVSGQKAVSTPTGSHSGMHVLTTDADVEVAFAYSLEDTSSNAYNLMVEPRYASSTSRLQLRFYPDKILVQ